MAIKRPVEAPPESDRFLPAPHPRDTFEFFGHAAAEAELLQAYRCGRLPQAWIIGGPQGIGKATLAWRMARFLAVHPDATDPAVQAATSLDVDPESLAARKISALSFGDLSLLRREWNEKTKKHATRIIVDDVRRAIRVFEQSAGEGGWRMVLLDSADDLNPSSANAMLKLIEDPPPKCLFLIIAHQPGRIMPTIRSRCRLLMLGRLSEPDLRAALRTALANAEDLAAADKKVDEAVLAQACARADGSVREALRRLSGADAAVDRLVEQILSTLPNTNWRLAHRLADIVVGREKETEYAAFLQAIFAWLAARIHDRKALGPRALAPYADAWERLERDARDVEIYNLDKRAFIIGLFTQLARAESGILR